MLQKFNNKAAIKLMLKTQARIKRDSIQKIHHKLK